MIPLIDTHCHLLAGLDDGPASEEEALAMCRLAYEEGTRIAAATARQNDHYPDVTPDRIRQAWGRLARPLAEASILLVVFPNAEVMAHPDSESSWAEGKLLSVADRRQYLLVEMPHGLFVDLGATVRGLVKRGVRPVLAHPERQEELLDEPGRIERLTEAGCQGPDGHSVRSRPPELAAAYRQIRQWAGSAVADRVCSTFGMAVLQGLPVRVPRPEPVRRCWVVKLW